MPPGDEKAPQHRRHRHPRQTQRRDAQCPRRPGISQPPPCGEAGQTELGRQRRHSQPGPRQQKTVQHPPGLGRASGQLFGHQAGGRHRYACRRQRDEKRVDRQHQLIQPHPLAAQRVRQPDAQPHPCQPEQDICSGHQGRVFQIALPHCAPSLSCSYLFIGMHAALGNMSGGVGCFFPSFMI